MSRYPIKGEQLQLWQLNTLHGKEIQSDISKFSEDKYKPAKIPILFRTTIPEIPTTTYGTFSIYKYPAKFIPQVIAYTIKTYGKKGMRIFDPFGGYGTVGVVARIYGLDYELWDLNPILEVIHNTAIIEPSCNFNVKNLLDEIKNFKYEFYPDWSNLQYWFPEEWIPLLGKAWGYAHSLPESQRYLLYIPLINTTKYFSYADEKVHKLYKSKQSKKKVEKLLGTNWKSLFYQYLEKEIFNLLKKISEYNLLKPQKVNSKIRTGVDALETSLEKDVNLLITSPPYLQAQEYIRSTKMELFWLGYSESYIKELSKKEIPYRRVPEIEILSETYHKIKEQIAEPQLAELYKNYFNAILKIFTALGNRVTDHMCIFVGPAKIRTYPVPIDDIIVEHLSQFGWKHEVTYIDKIVGRVMFETKINPASGEKDSRIKTEHLIILRKNR